jgi:hypothetical protein
MGREFRDQQPPSAAYLDLDRRQHQQENQRTIPQGSNTLRTAADRRG